MRRWLCLLLLLGACHLPDTEVRVTLQNDSDQTLRCLLVFAHWMTEELPPLLAGERTQISLARQSADGAIYRLRSSGQRALLENISCGFDADWRPEAVVGLLPLQEGPDWQATLVCVQKDHLSCQFVK